jgi:hypothetical protein
MAGGPWPLVASLLTGAMVAYLGAPSKSDPMNAAAVSLGHGAIATLAVLSLFFILQLVLTPRRMESALRELRPAASGGRLVYGRHLGPDGLRRSS